MARTPQRPGLKTAIFGSFTAALVLILAVLFYFVPAQVEGFLRTRVDLRGRAKVQEVARVLSAPGQALDARASGALNDLRADDADLAFIALVGPRGEVLARTDVGPADLAPLVAPFRGAATPEVHALDGQRVFSAPVAGPSGLRALVGVDYGSLDEVLAGLRRTVLVACLVGFLLFVVLVFYISRFFILRPLDAMMGVARKLAEADLTGRVEVESRDELGQMAQALNRIGQGLRETLGRVRGVSEGVAGVIEQLSRTGAQVSAGAATAQGRIDETGSSLAQMMASLRGIAENVETLYQAAEESSSSIMEMAATNDEVAENVQAMAASVEQTTSAIEEMTFSIKEVARNVDALKASTEETSSSISEMDASIGQVEAHANETARLSERVSEDAQSGVESLRKTLSGIDRIKDSSAQAAGVIESLGRRVREIGSILNVIDDVAEQTNLLALNAAIIAAQAGEHGKGFAVVAEEIKDLAERTGASTKEIADLIRAVQEESRNAVSVMNQGVKHVEEGVQLGREAEGALRKISGSATQATQMVKAIARATVEQARGSRAVTQAIHRIAETVQQIAQATGEQAKGSEQIMKSAERMKSITQHVQRSSQEQANGSRQITRAIASINEMAGHLNRAQKEQAKGGEQVLAAVEAIKAVSEQQTRSVRQLEEAIDGLTRQAEVLRAEVRRFRV